MRAARLVQVLQGLLASFIVVVMWVLWTATVLLQQESTDVYWTPGNNEAEGAARDDDEDVWFACEGRRLRVTDDTALVQRVVYRLLMMGFLICLYHCSFN